MRAVVIILIAVLSGYLLWLGLRWLHLSSRRRRRAALGDFMVLKDVPPFHAHGEYVDTEAPFSLAPSQVPHTDGTEVADVASLRGQAVDEHSSFEAGAFQISPFETTMELRQLRHALSALQGQHEQLVSEVQVLRSALESLQTAARVSPQYGEAVSLARQGFDAQGMAERCGISVSEAELVRALAGATHKEDS